MPYSDRMMPFSQKPQAQEFIRAQLGSFFRAKPDDNSYEHRERLIGLTFGCPAKTFYEGRLASHLPTRPAQRCLETSYKLNSGVYKPNNGNDSRSPIYKAYIDTGGFLNDDYYAHTISFFGPWCSYVNWRENHAWLNFLNINHQNQHQQIAFKNISKYMCVASLNNGDFFISGYRSDKNRPFWAKIDLNAQVMTPYQSALDATNIVLPIGGGFVSASNNSGMLAFMDLRMKDCFNHFDDLDNRIVHLTANGNEPTVLAAGLGNGEVVIYDIRKQKSLQSFQAHNAGVRGLSFSTSDRSLFATGGGMADQAIRLWNWKTGAKCGEIKANGQLMGLDFFGLHRLFATTGLGRSGLLSCQLRQMHKNEQLGGTEGTACYDSVRQITTNEKTKMLDCIPMNDQGKFMVPQGSNLCMFSLSEGGKNENQNKNEKKNGPMNVMGLR